MRADVDERRRRRGDGRRRRRTRFGGLDILVNNAGVGHRPQPLEALAEDEFDRIFAVNVKAIYLTAREVVPRFKAPRDAAAA